MATSKGPGRPKSPDGKSVTLSVKVSEVTAASVDRARAGRSRSEWLQSVIAEALAGCPQRRSSQRPRGMAPTAAEFTRERERDQREDACPHPKASVIKGRCSRCQTFVGF